MTPKISVIVLVYNGEKYLRQCLESIISQSLFEIEILAINDGSNDNSISILNEYSEKDERISIYTHTNHGISYSANRGLSIAQGDYVYFVANDDYIEPEGLEVLYKYAIDYGLDILTFDVLTLLDSDKTLLRNINREDYFKKTIFLSFLFFGYFT